MAYWLMKSEPHVYGIDNLMAAPARTIDWFGVRNYQARNFMRDQMSPGDGVLFYHSSCAEPGIAGLAEVASSAFPDPTQFDPSSHYFDAKATREQPRWFCVDVRGVEKTPFLSLKDMRAMPALEDMLVLKKGSRLSITPVTAAQWRAVMAHIKQAA
jgi:predicted RNA-binding protein with PUA-like domain